MSWTIEYSPKAQQDLDNIFEYISSDGNAETAAAHISRLVKAADSLNKLPLRHRLYDAEPWHSMGVRFLTVGRYLIFYRPDADRRTILIIRILHGARDLGRALIADT